MECITWNVVLSVKTFTSPPETTKTDEQSLCLAHWPTGVSRAFPRIRLSRQYVRSSRSAPSRPAIAN